MNIGDIYKHNKYNQLITIHGFLRELYNPDLRKPLLICVAPLQMIENKVGFAPMNLKYATSQFIRENYTLFIPAKDIKQENYTERMNKCAEILNEKE